MTSKLNPSEKDKQEATILFQKLDKNKDGKLSDSELRHGLRDLKLPSTDSAVTDLIKKIDTDKNGEITQSEFVDFVTKRKLKLRQIFNQLDKNKNGVIEIHEVQDSIKELGINIKDEQDLAKLFSVVDKNKSGSIDFEEWLDFLLLVPQANIRSVFRYWEEAKALDLGDGPLPGPKPGPLQELAKSLLTGAVAGGVSRTATAPLERLKILYQIQHHKPEGIVPTLIKIYHEGGVRGFFRGNGANILKVAPESAVKFFAYDTIKQQFAANDADVTPQQRMVAGACAGIIAHGSLFPLEVIKTRLAAAPDGTYKGIVDVVLKTARTEGYFKPFYRGLSASILSTIPHSAIDLTIYESLKHENEAIIRRNGDKEPGAISLLACASFSTICGQLVAYPLHVVKARLVTQTMGGKPKVYSGPLDCITKIAQQEGYKGLYRGLLPSCIKAVPSHAITFVVYEYLKRYFNLEKKKKH